MAPLVRRRRSAGTSTATGPRRKGAAARPRRRRPGAGERDGSASWRCGARSRRPARRRSSSRARRTSPPTCISSGRRWQRAATFSDAFRRTVWATPALDYTLTRPWARSPSSSGRTERRAERDARWPARGALRPHLPRPRGLRRLQGVRAAVARVRPPPRPRRARGLDDRRGTLEGWPEAVPTTGAPRGSALAGAPLPAVVLFDTETRRGCCRSASASSPRTSSPSASSSSPPWRPAMTIERTHRAEHGVARRPSAALALGLLRSQPPLPVRSDVLSEMTESSGGARPSTPPARPPSVGQASGHWTLGNLYLRAPVRSEQIATVSLPSRSAPAAAASTPSPAPSPSSTPTSSSPSPAPSPRTPPASPSSSRSRPSRRSSPRPCRSSGRWHQWVNNQNLNSCETAQALVGAVWSRRTTGRARPSAPPSAPRRGSSPTTPPRATAAGRTAGGTRRSPPPPGRWPSRCRSTSTTPGGRCGPRRSSPPTPRSPSSRCRSRAPSS